MGATVTPPTTRIPHRAHCREHLRRLAAPILTTRAGDFLPITVLIPDDAWRFTFSAVDYAIITLDTGDNFDNYANVDIGNIVVATIGDPAGDDDAQPTAVIDWGDGSVTSASLRYDDTDDEYDILGDHVYDQAGPNL